MPDQNTQLAPPLPPLEYRRLVCPDDTLFDLPQDGLVFPNIPAHQYERVFDFGCGCGRVARKLMCHTRPPRQYVGIDIHRGMIEWCKDNLTSLNPAFEFFHHDVWNLGLAPENTRQPAAPFPVDDGQFSLVIAHSVFTHLYSGQTEFYLAEVLRILAPEGIARTTWFFFDKLTFPMMLDFQVCLFINEIDPSNAVVYDWRWFLEAIRRAGLYVISVTPPTKRGFQWEVLLGKRQVDSVDCFPVDPDALRQMCGSEVRPENPSALQCAVAPRPEQSQNVLRTHRLKFTGAASFVEFQARCSGIRWYHSYYFDNGYEVRGDYNIGADVHEYGFPESMSGLRVLDCRTGAGWFAHYFEQLGAEVVTVDSRGYEAFDVYGGDPSFEPPADSAPDRFDTNGEPVFDSAVSKGFWVMKNLLGSGVQFKNARLYDLGPELFGGELFDLVFLGAILCHVRDPIRALMAARRICRGTVIASTPVITGEPESEVLPRQYLPFTAIDRISWWVPNEACFRHWFLAAGFTDVDISRQVRLLCDVKRFEGSRALNGDQILRVGHARAG
jgi:SAM-dependent methyltransferase